MDQESFKLSQLNLKLPSSKADIFLESSYVRKSILVSKNLLKKEVKKREKEPVENLTPTSKHFNKQYEKFANDLKKISCPQLKSRNKIIFPNNYLVETFKLNDKDSNSAMLPKEKSRFKINKVFDVKNYLLKHVSKISQNFINKKK